MNLAQTYQKKTQKKNQDMQISIKTKFSKGILPQAKASFQIPALSL